MAGYWTGCPFEHATALAVTRAAARGWAGLVATGFYKTNTLHLYVFMLSRCPVATDLLALPLAEECPFNFPVGSLVHFLLILTLQNSSK